MRSRERRRIAPGRAPAPRVRVDKLEADPRGALATAAERSGEGLAALSRMIWRPSRYLDRFVRKGRPAALTRDEHAKLAAFFGVDERALGIRDLWLPA